MPVFLNNQGASVPKKKKKTLTTYFPTLTGKPQNAIGWFNSNHQTLMDKLNQLKRTVKWNSGKPYDYADVTLSDLRNIVLATNGLYTKIKDVTVDLYGNKQENLEIHLLGFEQMTTTHDSKKVKVLVPVMALLDQNGDQDFDVFVEPNSFDLNYSNDKVGTYRSYPYLDESDVISMALEQVSLEELYDQAMRYYFDTNMTTLLTDLPMHAHHHNLSDTEILRVYALLKRYQGKQKLTSAQLEKFVKNLLDQSTDIAVLKQLLLEFPELTFASLSEQFEQNAQNFPLL